MFKWLNKIFNRSKIEAAVYAVTKAIDYLEKYDMEVETILRILDLPQDKYDKVHGYLKEAIPHYKILLDSDKKAEKAAEIGGSLLFILVGDKVGTQVQCIDIFVKAYKKGK